MATVAGNSGTVELVVEEELEAEVVVEMEVEVVRGPEELRAA
jgi:hypothetical protein